MKSISVGVPMMLKMTDLNKPKITADHELSGGNHLFFCNSCPGFWVETKDSKLSQGTKVFFK